MITSKTWHYGRIQIDYDLLMLGVGLGFCFSNGSAFFCIPFLLITRAPLDKQ
jgi:hypothetical protein